MKKKNIIIIATSIFIYFLLIGFIVVYPSVYDYQCKSRTYNDMETELANVFSSNISVITVTEHDDIKGYSVGASGVVFDKVDSRYFALTAYHIVANQDTYLIFTTNDETLSEYREKHSKSGHVSLEGYYGQLAEAKVEYTCEESDLAIISFESNEELFKISISENAPVKGEKIAVVGTLEGNYFETTYGTVTSKKPVTFYADDEQCENNVLKHNAYVAPGSSGGAVFNYEMKLVGLNIGGGTDILGRFKYGVMIPCEQIQQCINNWQNQ